MGDVAMTVPVVAQLRRDNPALRITVMTRPKFVPFFRDIPQVEFLLPDLEGRHKGFAGMVRLGREAHAAGVTTVADLHDVLRSKIVRTVLRLSGARVAALDKGRADKRALARKFRKVRAQLTPTVERYRKVLLRLGLTVGRPVPVPHAPRPLPAAVEALTGPKEGVWIGVAPFSLHKGKVYPTVLADQLIGLLAGRYSRVLIFGGGKHEGEFADCMEQRHPGVVSMIGRVGLAGEMDLISNLDCLVSMDSGSMHIASNVGTPVVSVWGATHPRAGFYGFGQRPEDAVQLDLPCRPCSVYGNRPCIYKDYRCMEHIPPEMIADRVAGVVARG